MATPANIHLTGTRAAQPSAASVGVGVIYYVEDEFILERSDGAAWGEYSNPASLSDGDKGDIIVSGAGATWTIDNLAVTSGKVAANAVTDAKLRQGAALTVIGRSANSTGDVADIAAGSDGHVLRRSGTTLGFGTIATAGIADDAVTYAKMQNVSATQRLLGRNTAGSGDVEEVTAAQLRTWLGAVYRLHSSYTPVGTTTSGSETDLQTYTFPANTLATDGQRVRIKASGTFAATTRSRTPRLYFGSASVAQATTSSGDTYWAAEFDILRTSSSGQIFDIWFTIGANAGAVTSHYRRNVATSVDLTADQTIKVTGLVGGTPVANDIVCNFMTVELAP